MEKIKVFVSSCMEELRDARKAASLGLNQLKQEGFVEVNSFVFELDAIASPNPVYDVWRRELDDSDVYIGIFYKKYGKYTIEEFQLARQAGLPCFIYICDFQSNRIGVIEREPELEAFLRGLHNTADLTPARYTYAHELSEKVPQAMRRWYRQKGLQASKELIKVQKELKASKIEIENLNHKIINIEEETQHKYDDLETQLILSCDKEMSLEEQIIQLKSQLADKSQQLMEIKSELEDAKSQNVTQKVEIAQLKEQLTKVETSDLAQKQEIESQIIELQSREMEAKRQFEALEVATLKLDRISNLSLNVNKKLWQKHGILSGIRDSDAYAYILRGDKLYMSGDFQKAILYYEKAATLASSQENYRDQLEALSRLSFSWGHLANYQKEIEGATRLLALARQHRLEEYEVGATFLLVEALAEMDLRGHRREIKFLLLTGLQTSRFLRNNYYEVYHLLKLGKYGLPIEVVGDGFVLELDEYSIQINEMKNRFIRIQEALNTLRPGLGKDQYYFRGEIYSILSSLMLKNHKPEDAVYYAKLSIDAFTVYDIPIFILRAHIALARAQWTLNEQQESFSSLEERLPQTRHFGWKREEMEIEYLMGEAKQILKHTDEAKVAFQRALKLAQEMKLKEREVECMLSLGRVLVALKDREEARTMVNLARRLSQERNYDDHFHTADALLQALGNQEGGEERNE